MGVGYMENGMLGGGDVVAEGSTVILLLPYAGQNRRPAKDANTLLSLKI